ncbi:regulator of ribonuclease activity [Neisseria iguanae]|uniref:RraA family protein n=1 Tax=Neisseria iguanae TaxID=90242 RepID=UPI001FE8A7B0|nr:regulator of ribonuclease activity [Neisseria iguanae]
MTTKSFTTADLTDIAPDTPCCGIQFKSFGNKCLSGKIHTLKCFRDNSLLHQTLNQKSDSGVLVVDNGGSLASALMGSMLAEAGCKNGWAGIVIYGAVRDSATIDQMDFDVKALGTNHAAVQKITRRNRHSAQIRWRIIYPWPLSIQR